MRLRFSTCARPGRGAQILLRFAAGAALSAAGLAAPARAQTTLVRPEPRNPSVTVPGRPSETAGPADLRARQQALLERTLRAPLDFEATYDYVEASARLGDTEAAIGALERLLNYDPRLVRARYELGALYFRMGSFDAAAHYLRTAAESPTLDPAIQARVEALYPEAVKQQGQSRWSVFLQGGLRYQSNASFIPAGGVLRLGGQDFLLTPQARRRGDGSAFGLAQVGNDYDLQNQRGDVLETRAVAFGSKQFQAGAYDFGYLEASFGPRLGLPELMPGASIKPYAVGQTAFLGGERAPYLSSAGGGVTMRLPAAPGLTLEPGVEARILDVNGQDGPGAAAFGGGSLIAGYLTASLNLTPDIDVEARFVGVRSGASRAAQDFVKGAAALAVSFQFAPPSALIARKWRLSPFVSGAYTGFDRSNPGIDPIRVREDREYGAGLILDAPLTGMLGLSALVQYDRVDSNLPNYRQRGLTVLGGPTARF